MNRIPPTVTLLAALASASALAQTQAWDYVSYKKEPTSGQYLRDLTNAGTLELLQHGDKAYFRIIAGSTDVCHRGDIEATVTRGDEVTTITMTQAISGCPLLRYVIRNDGSGGRKELRRDGRWIDDRFDHGLTPKK